MRPVPAQVLRQFPTPPLRRILTDLHSFLPLPTYQPSFPSSTYAPMFTYGWHQDNAFADVRTVTCDKREVQPSLQRLMVPFKTILSEFERSYLVVSYLLDREVKITAFFIHSFTFQCSIRFALPAVCLCRLINHFTELHRSFLLNGAIFPCLLNQ